MNELYNSVYGLKPPIVEGLLNSGAVGCLFLLRGRKIHKSVIQ